MAWSMANSIKLSNPDTHITILTDDTCMEHIHNRSVFNDVIEIPMGYYIDEGKFNAFKAALVPKKITSL